jgi:signal transduction histidine kinase
MMRLRGRSIRSTLALALWGAALIVFLLGAAGVALFQRLTLERRARQSMEPYAQLVAVGADAAIAFEDPARAQEILDTLRANPEILSADLFLADGRLLATYARVPGRAPPPPPGGPDGVTVGPDAVELIQTLSHDARLRLGMGLGVLTEQTNQVLWVFVAFVLVLLAVTFVQARILGHAIVGPIAALTEAAEGVRAGAGYALRAPAAGTDEVARLARSLESMLEAIREREQELRRLNRELRALSDCNQLLIRAEDEQTLLDRVCRIVCDGAGYRMAWVGFAEDDPGKTVRPVARAGVEDGYLASARPSWADTERGRGPVGRAIRTGESACIQDFETDPSAAPWREEARRHGYRAAIALPLADGGGRPYGVLAIYSSEPDAFTPDEVRLLERLSADLSFGVVALRTRIERVRAEAEVVTLNQALEQRVAERTSQLEMVNRELEAFAYSVSHDLRAPIRHIGGFVELLQRKVGPTLDPEAEHYMAAVAEATRRMAALIDDLLAFSRMGRADLARSQVDLNAIVAEVRRELAPEAVGREVTWRVAELPVVSGDPAMLRLVVTNLVSNALKFTAPRPRAEIEIGRLADDGREVVIYVRDNGVGFDMRYVDKLFGVFQRLHGARQFDGTGIGLASVRRVIARHGGRTWAEGQLDAGATFYFALPRGPGGTAVAAAPAVPGSPAARA